jgi:hypothetical protein
MATTTRWGLTLMEVGQKDKTTTINSNMNLLDVVPKYLGELAADPATTNVPFGSTYYNTVSSKLRVLRTNAVWVNVA